MSAKDKKSAIESALERAANAAVHGSPQIKSGQLDPEIEPHRVMITRILSEAQAAYRTWAHWEAINDKLAANDARDALDHLGLSGIGTVRLALVRDTILSALRLSDQVGKDKVTLCNLSAWLESDAVCNRLASEQWALDLGYKPWLAKSGARQNGERLSRFKALVPARWPKDKDSEPPPTDPTLMDLRVVLRDVRDTRLAHLLIRAPEKDPQINQIRRLLDLTLELSTDMAFVILGSAADAEHFKEIARKQAEKLWREFFRSPVDTYQQDMLRKEQALAGFSEDTE